MAGDSVIALTQSFASRNVLGPNGSTLNVDAGFTVNDGNAGGNYSVVTNTAAGTITAKALTAAGLAPLRADVVMRPDNGGLTVDGIAGNTTIAECALRAVEQLPSDGFIPLGHHDREPVSGRHTGDGNFVRHGKTGDKSTCRPRTKSYSAVVVT